MPLKRYIPILLLLCAAPLHAQLWSGIIAPSRATDWSGAGATIPTNWTQCGSTIAAYSGTAATINTALAACPNDTYLLLGAGTFNLSTGIDFAGRSSVILRGSGANQSMLVFTGTATCSGLYSTMCVEGDSSLFDKPSDLASDNSASWTATSYTAGQTQITLGTFQHGALTTLHVGNPIVLDQCDDGLSGPTCGTGASADTGQVWVCETLGAHCADLNPAQFSATDGPSGGQRPGRAQEQIVTVTAISGSLVTFTPGLRMPNWSAAKSPEAFWSSAPVHDVGIEDLSSDFTAALPQADIVMWNCFNCWVKGIRSIETVHDAGTAQRNHVWLILSPHATVRDSYFFGSESLHSEGYGVEAFGSGDDLIENNIMQEMPSPQMINGECEGCVIGYNYSINDANDSAFLFNSLTLHAPTDYTLVEGNVGNSFRSDLFHGSHNFNTGFRNYFNGWESTGITNGFTADYLDPLSRYYNMVGNVFGEPSFFTCYQETPTISCAQWPVYTIGTGTVYEQTAGDALTVNSMMRWGNYDTFNGATHFLSSEVPTSFADTSGTPSLYVNPVPANDNLPASFYYSSKPSWWPASKPWPAIGPDVTGGNIAGLGGHAYTIPAEDCYTNVMHGPADGTGSALSFNAATCYSAQADPAPRSSLTYVAGTSSSACHGGPPHYCADSSPSRIMMRSAVQYPALDPNDGGPAVGVPFEDPDTGTRMTRVTDGMTAAGTGLSASSDNFMTNASAEAYSCSNFNAAIASHGGYVCWFQDQGAGGYFAFMIDATTMQTQVLHASGFSSTGIVHSEVSPAWTDPWAVFTSVAGLTFDAYCIPAIANVYPSPPANDPNCGNTFGSPVALFTASASTCGASFPAGASGWLGEVQASADDTKLSGYANGRYVIWINRSTNPVTCAWYDTATHTVGGSSNSGLSGVEQTTTYDGLPAPLTNTTPSAGTGGTFAAGTYCFAETFVGETEIATGNYGEETNLGPGAPACIALSLDAKVTLTRPTLGGDSVSQDYMFDASFGAAATPGWNVYGCQESSPPTVCTPNALQNAAMIPWNTSSTTLSTLAAGAAPPSVNVAGYIIHQSRLSPSGTYVETTGGSNSDQPGYSFWCWMVGTGTPTQVTHHAVPGHIAPGWDFVMYNDGGGSFFAPTDNSRLVAVYPTDPSSDSNTVFNSSVAPGFTINGDMHPSWADDYQAAGKHDYMPLCGGMDPRPMNQKTWSGPIGPNGEDAANGNTVVYPNGTTNRFPATNYNPDWSTMAPKNGELLCEAADGSGTTWRFGHSRSSKFGYNSASAPVQPYFYPSWVLATITRDAKFMIFTSYWDWDLGTWGDYSWAPNTAYTTGTTINDSNGNLEIAQSNFTSGATIPAFSTAVNGLSNDGATTGAWKMSQTGACPLNGQCRFDVFVAELK